MRKNSFPAWLAAALGLAVVAVLVGGAWFYFAQKKDLQRKAEAGLQAVAELKTDQIATWRSERLADAAVLTESQFFAEGVQKWMASPTAADAIPILARFQPLRTYNHYEDVLLVDPDGQVLLSLEKEPGSLGSDDMQTIEQALRKRQPLLTDIHMDADDPSPHLDVIAPLFSANDVTSAPLGAVILTVDARQFLYPLIELWPAQSRTAETLLVRQDGNDVLFLNDLRHLKNASLEFRVPRSRAEVPAVMAVFEGKEGVVPGKDYRGVQVLSALKHIPDSPWFMVAKVDEAEALSTWRNESLFILALVLLLIGALTASAHAIWQRKQKAHYRSLAQAQEALRESEERHRTTLLGIGDAVIATDSRGHVDLLNPVAETLTGWSQAEAAGKPLAKVFHIVNETTRETVENPAERVLREGTVVGLANHTVLIAKDGAERPIADSGAPIHSADGAITGVVLVFRDQTEQKMAEDALRASEERYRSLFRSLLEGFAYCQMLFDDHGRPVDFVYLDVNEAFGQLTGLTDVVGKRVTEALPGIRESSPELFEIYGRVATTGHPEHFEFDFKPLSQWLSVSAYSPGRGYFIAVFENITERKQEESEREVMLHLLRLLNSADNRHALIQDVTTLMQRWSGCEAVGIRLRDGNDYPYFETRGFPAEFVEAERHLCVADPNGEAARDASGNPILECMCGNVICGRVNPALPFFSDGGSFWSNCTTDLLAATTEADRQARTRNRCNGEGYESVALIPLRFGGEALGLLQFNDRGKNMFTPDRIRLFERLADNLAVGLAQRQAAAKLEDSERDYRTLFSEMMDGFALHEIVCDDAGNPVDYRFLAVNPAFERMTGMKAENIVGRTVLEAMPGIERSWIETYGKVALTGEPVFFENSAADLQKHFQVTAYRPALGQFACIFSDITERKRAEEALRESEARLRLALEAANAGSWEWDLRTNRNIWSDECWRLYGLDRKSGDASYEIWRQSIHPDDRATAEAILNAATASGSAINLEWRVNTGEGPERWIMSWGRPLKDDAGRILSYRGIVVDITARKRAEEEKAKLQEQLTQAQKMESVGRLAGGVAHDFNNMLGVILGHAEMAMDLVDPELPLYAELEEITKAANRSADLTQQLLAFARKQTVAPRVLDLNETVAGMLKMLRRLIGEDIGLAWVPGAKVWPVKVDPSQIDQILANLCVNARDAIEGVGKITIETENSFFDKDYCADHAGFAPGEYVRLTVTDNGCGMDQETLGHIFEPFFTTKGVGKGTGLGLATVYGIVRQNNGFINAYSEPGHGTRFTVYLPRHIGEEEPAQTKIAAAAMRGHETILLVEDEPAILGMTQAMLEKQGYTVLAANTPDEALRLAGERKGEVHLLITDVVMPEMNGRDLARKLLSLYPNLKRLFMSGYTANAIAHHGVLDSGVRFVQKPFTVAGLCAKVREALEQDGKEE